MTSCLLRLFSLYPLSAWFAALALGAWGVAIAGLELQHLLRLAPCPYCIFQRLLYFVLSILGVIGFLFPHLARLWLLLIGGVAGLGALLAAYQSWMQAFPALASECSYTDPNFIESFVDWLGMQWPGLFLATGFCTSKEWVFLGMSMANWSFLLFAAIVAYALLLWRHRESG